MEFHVIMLLCTFIKFYSIQNREVRNVLLCKEGVIVISTSYFFCFSNYGKYRNIAMLTSNNETYPKNFN